jgi:7-cyano-7-deazaguanine synthase
MNRVILLLSGGIDSTTLLAKLTAEKHEVVAISYRYEQKNEIELAFAKKNANMYEVELHKVINLESSLFGTSALINSDLKIATFDTEETPLGDVDTYVPFRNMIFLSIALSIAESMNINKVYIAINADDKRNYWDCNALFFEYLNKIAAINSDIKIITPFIEMSKVDVILLSKKLNVNINDTITCYNPKDDHECGECLSCTTKRLALKEISSK